MTTFYSSNAMLPGAAGLKGPFACLNDARYGILWGAMGAARDAYETALAADYLWHEFGDSCLLLPTR